ncbi:ArnT family glycosyltransferase [Butyrivibrio sp. XPD2006]|uniref:ArnT family glycosyltransferase n=1 Tax=Butyrivibrio sp. XPD2006 TaxID=1280668 RepID=UPI0003B5237F|nr:glycosyltransferase family 39 protein [Butyrivibrio sp. XPD2006]
MRLIDYYNYIATAAYILMGVAAVFLYFRGKKSDKEGLGDGAARIIFLLIMVVAAVIRLYKLGEIPLGLQQDEASIGYDAYTLATYGIDRNGYHWPIYPITWGCGGGSPLLIYLNVISISLFGPSIRNLRMIPAVCGILTVALFYAVIRIVMEGRRFRNEMALLGAAFLAVCPWHVILSRWSLDCNIMPFNLMLAFWLFMLGVRKNSTLFYCLSSAAFALCMYSYGAATIVIPILLLLMCVYGLKIKALTWKKVISAAVTFIVVFLPLLVFYAINYLGLPEIVTEHFCFNKFTAARTGEAFIALDGSFFATMLGNLKSMLLAVTVGDSGHTLAHFYPGYASLFEFTFPVTFLGLIICIKHAVTGKRGTEQLSLQYRMGLMLFISAVIGTAVLDIVILPDINRLVMLFIPFIFFFVLGAGFILEQARVMFVAVASILLIGALSFSKDYFTDYSTYALSIYMPGYGDAIAKAYEIAGDDRQIRSTYEGLSSPFMLALYYTNYDPYKFYQTVEYKDPYAEFRIAKSFGNFIFELPDDVTDEKYASDVFVVASSELELFGDLSGYNADDYGGYFVVYR